MKAVLIGLGVVLALVVLGGCGGYLSFQSSVTPMESGIIAQAQTCQQIIDTGFQQIIGTAQVDLSFKNMWEAIFTSPSAQTQQLSQTQFIAMMGTIGGTNAAATSIEVQRVIQATYQNVGLCQSAMADKQAAYANQLGIPVGALPGQGGTFPNAIFASLMGLPRQLRAEAPNSPKHDLDGDGKLTVFDYPAYVKIGGFGGQGYDNGAITPPAIYPTQAK